MTTSEDGAAIAPHHKPALNRMFMLRWEPAQDAHVLLYPEGVVKLNPTAAEILKHCSGDQTTDGIVAELKAAYPEGGAQLETSTRKFLDLAYAKGWINV
jgi:pyrroloquinoline quinone biosynthesis protein D